MSWSEEPPSSLVQKPTTWMLCFLKKPMVMSAKRRFRSGSRPGMT